MHSRLNISFKDKYTPALLPHSPTPPNSVTLQKQPLNYPHAEFVSHAKLNIRGRVPGRLSSHLSRETQTTMIPRVCNAVNSGLPLQAADILHAVATALGQLKLHIPGPQPLRSTGHAGNHMTQSVDCSHMIRYKQMTPGHCQLSHQLQKLKVKMCISRTADWIHNFKDITINQILD